MVDLALYGSVAQINVSVYPYVIIDISLCRYGWPGKIQIRHSYNLYWVLPIQKLSMSSIDSLSFVNSDDLDGVLKTARLKEASCSFQNEVQQPVLVGW